MKLECLYCGHVETARLLDDVKGLMYNHIYDEHVILVIDESKASIQRIRKRSE